MINAVNTTSAASPAGAAARPAGHEAAVRVAAPIPHVAAAASHESTVVTISAQAARSAQLAQVVHAAPASAHHGAGPAGKAPAPASQAGTPGQAAAPSEHVAQAPNAAPAPRIHATYISPAPAPLSLDPIPSQHLPAIAFSPADVNQDGHVSAAEGEAYGFHHAPSLAAQPGEAEADLSAYTSIARG